MSMDTNDFFKEKNKWSATKDNILSCYLVPYFTKVLSGAKNGLVYVDGFSGTGKFEDDSDGSPIIAINKLQEACRAKKAKPYVQMIFAEHDPSLRANLEANTRNAAENNNYLNGDRIKICTEFKDAMYFATKVRLKGSQIPSAYFYYLDPCGVKDLDSSLFRNLPNMDHTEILLNFCTVGFLRDACAALKIKKELPSEARDNSTLISSDIPANEREHRLSALIGNDGWKDILREFDCNKIDFWEAEMEIANLFQQNMSKDYQYVLNLPIKDMDKSKKSGGLLKYRLVHMTNNADGCILMNDNMHKRNQDNQVIQDRLFLVGADGKLINPEDIQQTMRESALSLKINKRVSMWQLLAPVIAKYGIFDSSTNLLRTYLDPLLNEGLVERVEKYTNTGRASRAFSNGSEIKVFRAK